MALTPAAKGKLEGELEKARKDNEYVRIIQQIEKKAQTAPFMNYCFKQQAELDALQRDYDKRANTALQVAQNERTQNFAYEMQRLKTEEFCDAKLRQQLRQDCPELRDLERKLNAAYANKILIAQIKEKEAKRIKEQMDERERVERYQRAHVPEKEYFKLEKEKELRAKEEYKRALQDQMIFQENERRTRYEEFLKEKKLIDELVARIQEEEERELQLKYCEMLRTQEEIRRFKESQRQWRAKAKERLEREDAMVQEFIRVKMEQSIKSAAEKEAREAYKAKKLDEMAKQMYIEKRRQTEKDEIIAELLEAEEREKHERLHREKLDKELRMRLEIHAALNTQMEERLEDMKANAERDARYKEELIIQAAEAERLEQLTTEKRRLRMLQLRRDIEETMKANRLKKAMDMQLKLQLHEAAMADAEKRRALIEDERVRMIKENAHRLLGYLPAGIMTESEMDKLGDDLKLQLICTEKPQL